MFRAAERPPGDYVENASALVQLCLPQEWVANIGGYKPTLSHGYPPAYPTPWACPLIGSVKNRNPRAFGVRRILCLRV